MANNRFKTLRRYLLEEYFVGDYYVHYSAWESDVLRGKRFSHNPNGRKRLKEARTRFLRNYAKWYISKDYMKGESDERINCCN